MSTDAIQYEHILRKAFEQPWALLPSKLADVREFLLAKARGTEPPPRDRTARKPPRSASPSAGPLERAGGARVGRVGLIPVFGTITQHAGLVNDYSGGTSTEAVAAALDAIVTDPTLKAAVLEIDSPGGSTFGLQELAARIRAATATKPVIAAINSLGASAAFWIASACSEVYASPGSMIGSIGVVSMHEDLSAALEKEGIKVSIITSSRYKAEGNSFAPLTDEARAQMQRIVDAFHADFVRDVARGRRVSEATVRSTYGEGRILTARAAKAVGMIDDVRTVDWVLDRAGKGGTMGPAAASARRSGPPLPTDVLRRQLDLAELDLDL